MNTTAYRATAQRDSVLARFMVGFDGHSLPDELAEYLARGLAGVVIYQRNFTSAKGLRELTSAIRSAAGRPVLIGIDQEGGTRFALREPFTSWPSAAELGRIGDPDCAEQVARAIAAELRAAGCNLDFAPMLDLHMNAESPVTKDRSFGADPHLDLPVFEGTMTRLETTELVPFAAAVAAGVPLVMTAHILLPRIDPDVPASLSRSILEGVLRRRLNFDGMILADDLGMGAIAKRYGAGEAAVRTF